MESNQDLFENFEDEDFIMENADEEIEAVIDDDIDIDDENIIQEFLQPGNNFFWDNIGYDNSKSVQYTQTRQVMLPKPSNMLAVDTVQIQKIKRICVEMKKTRFSYSELLLGLSTLFLGAFFSAMISQIPYEAKFLNIFFYTISPVLGVGMGVAYFFARKANIKNTIDFAKEIEDCIGGLDESDNTNDMVD